MSQKHSWAQQDLSVCLGPSADMERNLAELEQQQMAFNSNVSCPQSPFCSDNFCLMSDNLLRPHEGDQVVPSSQRRTVFGGFQKGPKPLPPLPDPEELMSDEAADYEVEFFTSDRRRLLPKSCPKVITRGRECGQVNHAYQERQVEQVPAGGAGLGSMAFSWPGRGDGPTGGGGGFEADHWAPRGHRQDAQHVASADGDSLRGKQSGSHQSRFRFSFSGQAFQPHSGTATCPTDKPLIPPRIPIPQRPPLLAKTASANEEDKPPKIPPRVPLVPPCPPRTPSPKSLPIYINGVMPATQSFAANPKYVSKASQRQIAERSPPAAQISPCIVPILKDGRQASATHYILLPPRRPPRTDRRERLHGETSRLWQNR